MTPASACGEGLDVVRGNKQLGLVNPDVKSAYSRIKDDEVMNTLSKNFTEQKQSIVYLTINCDDMAYPEEVFRWSKDPAKVKSH